MTPNRKKRASDRPTDQDGQLRRARQWARRWKLMVFLTKKKSIARNENWHCSKQQPFFVAAQTSPVLTYVLTYMYVRGLCLVCSIADVAWWRSFFLFCCKEDGMAERDRERKERRAWTLEGLDRRVYIYTHARRTKETKVSNIRNFPNPSSSWRGLTTAVDPSVLVLLSAFFHSADYFTCKAIINILLIHQSTYR